MLRHLPPVLAAVLLSLCGVGALAAQAADTAISVVQGVADGDLLNLRATASPVAKVETRLPNGASLQKFGCSLVSGYEWCEVQDTDNPEMRGWVPSRYLRDASPAEIAAASATMATGATERVTSSLADAGPTAGEAGDRRASIRPADTEPGSNTAAEDEKIALPPDLAARLGGPPAATDAEQKSAAAVRKAMQDAYGLAFAADGRPAEDDAGTTAEASLAAAPEAVTDDGPDDGGKDTGPSLADVPLPTPRPDRGETAPAAEAGPETLPAPSIRQQPSAPTVIAQAQGPVLPVAAAPPDATGDVPCARYVGQPMTHCAAAVARKGEEAADVTVTWPDGGTRIINFRDGKPAGANSRGAFRFTREGTLNMIRIGLSERFEITDALPFGD